MSGSPSIYSFSIPGYYAGHYQVLTVGNVPGCLPRYAAAKTRLVTN